MSDVEAMIITVRINRAKGSHLAFKMADYVKEIIIKYKYPIDQLAQDIGGTIDEVQLLMRNDVFEAKNVENWAYSEAWFPGERQRAPTLWDLAEGKDITPDMPRTT